MVRIIGYITQGISEWSHAGVAYLERIEPAQAVTNWFIFIILVNILAVAVIFKKVTIKK